MQANKPTAMAELGELCSRMGKPKDAEHWYRGAVRLDETSFAGLLGLARCQLHESEELARQQLGYLVQMRPRSPELLLLAAKLAGRAEARVAVERLDQAAEALLEVRNGRLVGCVIVLRGVMIGD